METPIVKWHFAKIAIISGHSGMPIATKLVEGYGGRWYPMHLVIHQTATKKRKAQESEHSVAASELTTNMNDKNVKYNIIVVGEPVSQQLAILKAAGFITISLLRAESEQDGVTMPDADLACDYDVKTAPAEPFGSMAEIIFTLMDNTQVSLKTIMDAAQSQ